MTATPDFYNPIGYSIIKRRWFRRAFNGIDRIQVNHSQLHQDMFVLSVLDGKTNGSYLEIGAHEPIFISNTYLLESAFGWRGVGIELGSDYVQRHQQLRSSRCHCLDATKADYGKLVAEAGLGSVIDYLSVDTDPAAVTLAALKQINHEKLRFRVITFEHDHSAEPGPVRGESRAFLAARGYRLVVNDVAWGSHIVEDWWVHPELTDASIVDELLCVDAGPHEHDKYMYGGYRKLRT
jgi:hypothetical protein